MAPRVALPRWFLLSLLVLAPAAAAGELAPDVDAFYPEGPTAHGRDIFWAEMPLDRIRRFRDGSVSTVSTLPGCGPTAVKRTPSGDYWILCHLGHRVLRLSATFGRELDIAVDAEGHRIEYPNDGVVDEQGRLYFSSAGVFALEAPPSGFVMTADPHGRVKRLSGPLRYPNGVTINRRTGSLLVSEHLNRRILEIPLQAGRAGSPRVFFDFAEGGVRAPSYPLAGPDGLLITPAGHVVVAEYGAGRLLFISAAGRLLRVHPVPMPFVTNLLIHPAVAGALVVVGAFDNSGPMLGRVMTLALPQLP
jgi:sugar lactone lactonase YvrE